MKILSTLFLLFLTLSSSAQKFEWVHPSTGTIATSVDSLGNVYTVGIFADSAYILDNDTSFTLKGNRFYQTFISKRDFSGRLIWVQHLQGTGSSTGMSLTVDNEQNVVIAGIFTGSIDFDPGTGSKTVTATSKDIFILKLSSNSSYQWVKIIPHKGNATAKSITTDKFNNLYLTGTFYDTLDLGSGVRNRFLTARQHECYIIKFTSNGTILLGNHLVSSGVSAGNQVFVGDSGYIYLTGSFSYGSRIKTDTSSNYALSSNGGNDVFIVKLDTAADVTWAFGFGSNSNDEGIGIAVDSKGAVFTTGSFVNTVDFDPSSSKTERTSVGRTDIFVAKFDASGDFQWVNTMGELLDDTPVSLGIDSEDQLYLTGNVQGELEFDINEGNKYRFDVGWDKFGFVLKTNSKQELDWVHMLYKGTVTSLYVSDVQSVHLCGSYNIETDFNPSNDTIFIRTNLKYPTSFDLKLDRCGAYFEQLTFKTCDSYTSHSGSKTFKSPGNYSDTLTTNDGCDSIFAYDILMLDKNTHDVNFDTAFKANTCTDGYCFTSGLSYDRDNNLFFCGYYKDSLSARINDSVVTFGSLANYNGFVQKLSSSGDTEWIIDLGGPQDDYIMSLAVDDSSNVYATGYFSGSVDFDPGPGRKVIGSNGSSDFFVCKYSEAGKLIWVKTFGGSRSDYAEKLVLTEANEIILTGNFLDTVDFDPGPNTYFQHSTSGYHFFVLKLKNTGDFVWVKSAGNSSSTLSRSVAVSDSGNIYTTGRFVGRVDFDPTVGTKYATSKLGTMDAFVWKLDGDGNFIWVKTFGGNDVDYPRSIVVDKDENVYVGGYFKDKTDLDPSTDTFFIKSDSLTDAFIMSLDSSGKFRWGSSVSGKGQITLRYLTIDNTNSIYANGHGVDISTYGKPNQRDSLGKFMDKSYIPFLYKLSSSGKNNWFKDLSRPLNGNWSRTDISAVDINGNIVSTGTLNGSADFQPSKGDYILTVWEDHVSTVVSKLKFVNCCEPLDTSLSIKACNGYLSPSRKYYWTKSGAYKDTVQNISRCDSIISINLKIHNSTDTVINVETCYSFTNPSGTKKWTKSGVYNDTILNDNGCDSFITYNINILERSFSLNDETACNEFLSPSGKYLWTKSGKYLDTIPNKVGCDSIYFVDLTINDLTSKQHIFSCTPISSPSGRYQWNNSGRYLDTIYDAAGPGCDSFFIVDFTRGFVSSNVVSMTSCDSLISPSKRHVWRSSGTYLDTILNESGCDSLLTVNVTILKSTNGYIKTASCYEYTSPSGLRIWSSSGRYLDTITNSVMCDSIISVDLLIRGNSYGTINQTACFKFNGPSGNVYSKSGTYLDTISSIHGCDSIITINLTVNTVDTGVTQNKNQLVSHLVSGTYQWLDCDDDFKPLSGATERTYFAKNLGNYAVAVSENNCKDTSSCVVVDELSHVQSIDNRFVKIYPNPSSGIFLVTLPSSVSRTSITVTDIKGTLVARYRIEENDYNLKWPGEAGTYLVTIETDLWTEVFKLIKL